MHGLVVGLTVKLSFACAPRWEIALIGFIYPYWALAHPVVGPPFQVQDRYRQTTLLRGRDYEAGRTVALILVLCIY